MTDIISLLSLPTIPMVIILLIMWVYFCYYMQMNSLDSVFMTQFERFIRSVMIIAALSVILIACNYAILWIMVGNIIVILVNSAIIETEIAVIAVIVYFKKKNQKDKMNYYAEELRFLKMYLIVIPVFCAFEIALSYLVEADVGMTEELRRLCLFVLALLVSIAFIFICFYSDKYGFIHMVSRHYIQDGCNNGKLYIHYRVSDECVMCTKNSEFKVDDTKIVKRIDNMDKIEYENTQSSSGDCKAAKVYDRYEDLLRKLGYEDSMDDDFKENLSLCVSFFEDHKDDIEGVIGDGSI